MSIASAFLVAARGPNLASSPLAMAIGAAAEAVIADCFGLSSRRPGAQPSEQPAANGDWRRRRSDNSPMPYFLSPRWPSLLSTDPPRRFIQLPPPISSPVRLIRAPPPRWFSCLAFIRALSCFAASLSPVAIGLQARLIRPMCPARTRKWAMLEGERRPLRHPPPHHPGKFVYTDSIRIKTAEPSPAAAILWSGFAHFRPRAVLN